METKAHVEAGMTLSDNVKRVRALFTQRECTFLIIAAAHSLTQNMSGYQNNGLPPGCTQEQWDESQADVHGALGKLWVAMPMNAQIALQQQLLDAFNLNLKIESEQQEGTEETPTPGARV